MASASPFVAVASEVEMDHKEMQRLKADLKRMRMYALALEDRCHRLWAGIPDSDGDRDPMVPYLALHASMAMPDAGDLG